ncbi:MAG: hypothetical protein PHQ74_11400 [Crocinitomicaceae bacterium]|nr:hypothetical protein [Crocinitomicaceae bacterium]
MEEKTTNKQVTLKIAKLLADVQTGVPAKVKTALDALQVSGKDAIIEPLIRSIALQTDEECIGEIIEFLSSLKSTSASKEVMACLKNPELAEFKIQILSTIWNSPLDYSEYLTEFISLAITGDFLITLECLTILENLNGPFEEADILESQLLLKAYYEGTERDSQKAPLMDEIALLIKDIDRRHDLELD